MLFRSQPRFTAQLFFEYEDGSVQWIYSRPEDWKSSYGPIIYNDVFNGEHYDARIENARLGYSRGQGLALAPG